MHTSCAPPFCCGEDYSDEKGLVELSIIDRALPTYVTPAGITSSVSNTLAHAVASTPGSGDEPEQPPTNDSIAEAEETHHQKARFFLVAWTVASVVGMGTAVVAALAGGKVAFNLAKILFEVAAYGMGDTGSWSITRCNQGSRWQLRQTFERLSSGVAWVGL